jgi:hypothetical protein
MDFTREALLINKYNSFNPDSDKSCTSIHHHILPCDEDFFKLRALT